MATPARKTSAGTRITPPMPMHPIIRPDKVPSSAIHITSDNGTNIYPPWRRCIIVFPFCSPALAFVVLRIKVAMNLKRIRGKATLLYEITIIAMNTSIAL
ncbi:MAG: hypothetical protein WB689_33065 [Xanthobacteraceae bacterium]|jgi:hypothetical protein